MVQPSAYGGESRRIVHPLRAERLNLQMASTADRRPPASLEIRCQQREKGMSAMLAELATVLSKRDLRDLVEFLSSLK